MGPFDAFRDRPAATQYGEIHTTASVDVFDAGLIFAFAAIGFSFFILLPGYMGKERYSVALRISLNLFIGVGILLSNFGMEWKKSEVETTTQYKAFMSQEIKAKVGVKIGLRGVNVTLKGVPVKQKFDQNKTTEHVDYNEKFLWDSTWSQGRLGVGHHASSLNNEYREALHKGIPYPILLIAEYFTVDGGKIRWGRCFKLAGFYTQLSLWLAFSLWIITNILFLMVIRYGAYFLSLTGLVILLGDFTYSRLHYGPTLVIPFPEENLHFEFGWCFWLSLVTGFLCLFLGVLIVVLDYFFPGPVATFFNIDIVTEFEDIVIEEHEILAPDASSDNPENDFSTPSEDDTTQEGEPSRKRIHFVSCSRYAGISHRGPNKSPLAQSKSDPTAVKRVSSDSESSNGEVVPRACSVKINIDHSYDNEAFNGKEHLTEVIEAATERNRVCEL